jgi:hypothetical protein
MPQSRQALQQLLHIAEHELAHIEARLLAPVSEEESSNLLSRAAELHLKQEEIRALLNETS